MGQVNNFPAFLEAHAQILAYDFMHYIGGHLGRASNRTDVLTQQEYVPDMKHNCELAINKSATNDPILN